MKVGDGSTNVAIRSLEEGAKNSAGSSGTNVKSSEQLVNGCEER